jgi:phosphoglycolate phosphatase
MCPAAGRNRERLSGIFSGKPGLSSFTQRYDLFVFDLDGTLADTREDIAASVNHALKRLGLPALDMAAVTRFVGDGVRVLLERALGPAATRERTDEALREFLEHYAGACTTATRLYPGVREALEALRCRGKVLAVLTNKPILHSRKVLSSLAVEACFQRIVGGDTAPEKKPDPRGLLSILEALGRPPDRSLLVGDSGVDGLTARAAGVRWAWFRGGFHAEAPREPAADHVLSSLLDLTESPGG